MKLQGKPYVEIFISKKGNKCAVLKLALGYANRALTFDSLTIAEVCGISVAELMALAVGTYEC